MKVSNWGEAHTPKGLSMSIDIEAIEDNMANNGDKYPI